jgi:hypothetical protein
MRPVRSILSAPLVAGLFAIALAFSIELAGAPETRAPRGATRRADARSAGLVLAVAGAMPSQASQSRSEKAARDERTVLTWVAFAVLVVGLGVVTIQMLRHRRRVAKFLRFVRDELAPSRKDSKGDTPTPVRQSPTPVR